MTWIETIKAVARQRSTEESLELWGQPPNQQPRFNYRWEHLQAVARLCALLGEELRADEEVLTAAAWLHDIVKSHSLDLPEEADSELAARGAGEILLATDFPASKIDAVREAIRVHEGLFREQPIEQLEAAVLWDADKLSKLGATYLVHNLCSRPAFDPIFQDQPTSTGLVVQTMAAWLGIAERIVASMNTEPGRREAALRLSFLRTFVEELEGEWEKS